MSENLPVPIEAVAKPTGYFFDIGGHCTLPLSKDITMRRVEGVYNELDRKLWLVLVHLAFDNLGKKTVHETNLRNVAAVFRELNGCSEGIQWLIAAARRLRKAGVDWEDGNGIGTATLLSAMKIDKETGKISYEFGEILTQKILSNAHFYRIQIHFILGLSGKYTVSLYMLLEGLVNLRHPVLTVPLAELRQRLNMPEGKWDDWRNLNRLVLAPAMEQINAGVEKIGFSAVYGTLCKGRKIDSVVFRVEKTGARAETEKKISRRRSAKAAEEATGVHIPLFSGTDYENLKMLCVTAKLDLYAEEAAWRSWCDKKNKAPLRPVAAFKGWLKRRSGKTAKAA
jgi:hypothetical protein